MSTTDPTTDHAYDGALTAKVTSVLTEDDGGRAYDQFLRPAWMAGMSDRAHAVAAWAYTYGIAYGIARGEDPYEPVSSVAARAYAAAIAAHREFTRDSLGDPEAVTA